MGLTPDNPGDAEGVGVVGPRTERMELTEEGTMTHRMNRVRRTVCALLAGGMVFASSCSTADIQTVLAGIDAVAGFIDSDSHDDISFGNWLVDEFD